MDWKKRKIICEAQLRMCVAHHTDTLQEGVPVAEYWEAQLDDALNELEDENS